MATLTSGDTLSLRNLATATGNGTTNISLGNIIGSPSSGDNIGLSTFSVDTVDGLSGFTYLVENTTENYELTFSGEGSNFITIKETTSNFTWSVVSGTTITLGQDGGYYRALQASYMGPSTGQTVLQPIESHTIRVVFSDGFNDHIGSGNGYGVNKEKTVYSVDSYDGNATDLCLPVDTLITLANGEQIEIGDVEEGMELKGVAIQTLGENEDDYLDWSSDSLFTSTENVVVKNVVFSFAKKMYSINGGDIIGTPEHPLLVKDSSDNKYKFKQIFRISVGDYLIKKENNTVVEVEVTDVEILNGTEEIVSIDVESQDTYLSNGYISHNKGGNSHEDLPVPEPPNNLAYAASILTWDDPGGTGDTGVTAYDIQVDDTSTSFNSLVINETEYSATSFDITLFGDLDLGTYYARVRAIDHGLKGNWTIPISFTIS